MDFKQKQIDVICQHTKHNRIIPLRIKLEDEDGNQFFELIAEKLLVNAVYDKNTELIAVSDKNSVALTFTFYLEQKDVSNLLDNLTEKDIFVVKVK